MTRNLDIDPVALAARGLDTEAVRELAEAIAADRQHELQQLAAWALGNEHEQLEEHAAVLRLEEQLRQLVAKQAAQVTLATALANRLDAMTFTARTSEEQLATVRAERDGLRRELALTQLQLLRAGCGCADRDAVTADDADYFARTATGPSPAAPMSAATLMGDPAHPDGEHRYANVMPADWLHEDCDSCGARSSEVDYTGRCPSCRTYAQAVPS